MATLHSQTGVPKKVLYEIMQDCKKTTFEKQYLTILYEFFRLEKDSFFELKQKKRRTKTPALLGRFITWKRIDAKLSRAELAKKALMDTRAIFRLESGDAMPAWNSYTFEQFRHLLKFTDDEMKVVKNYVSASKNLEAIVRKKDY